MCRAEANRKWLGEPQAQSENLETVDNAIRDAEEKLQNERINTAEFLIRVGGATERSFRKMELLKEFEEEEENNALDDVADDNNYDNSDLFCEEVDEKDVMICAQDVMRNLLPILSSHADL